MQQVFLVHHMQSTCLHIFIFARANSFLTHNFFWKAVLNEGDS